MFRNAAVFVSVVVTGLLAVALASCSRAGGEAPVQELYIASPHGNHLKREFENAFSQWHQAKYGTPVKIQWPTFGAGGTSDIKRTLDIRFANHGPTSDCDILFGGGSGVFDLLDSSGYLAAPDPPIPDEVLAKIPEEVSGIPLRRKDKHWFPATMSRFGMVYNKTRLAELHLPTPDSWEQIASPGWFGQLSVADPSKSGSVRTCYEMILQTYGWEKGWPLLVRIFANAEAIQPSGSAPAEETGLGNTAAGLVIDFYGRVAVIKQGASVAGFVVPAGGSTLDADPIAVLKGAPHPVLASHMVEFVLSEAGQKIWTFRPGTPGGPQHMALGRLAVIPELYKTGGQYMTDSASPFEGGPPLKVRQDLQAQRAVFLGDLIKAALIDNHDVLTAARRAASRAGDPAEAMALLDTLPFPEAEIAHTAAEYKDAQKAAAMRAKWAHDFRERFTKVTETTGR